MSPAEYPARIIRLTRRCKKDQPEIGRVVYHVVILGHVGRFALIG
jgi:hypothetical protein